ncbi:MAG: DUF1643 domain-containing protein [Sulfitobacter sp.]|nr:DUF1643 domain-containing protein [Sulfitobacter sp.]
MITRSHTKGDAPSTALYSTCERYRYSLERAWDANGPRVMFVMLNPSTATEVQNDPTVERCERRARHLGYGAFRVTNIFAWRATDPRDMRAAADPVGGENDTVLLRGADWADAIIAAWGVHGAHLERGPEVAEMMQGWSTPLYHLGLSKEGHPRHPLYLPYAQQPVVWERRKPFISP